jgi:hypothetical protein
VFGKRASGPLGGLGFVWGLTTRRTSGSGAVLSGCLAGSQSVRQLFYCLVMGASSGGWVEVIAYQNLTGQPRPADALAAWLHDRGIGWMPFADDDFRIDLACGKKPGRPPAELVLVKGPVQ